MQKRGEPFFLWNGILISLAAFSGFTITYFGPMSSGDYPTASSVVHLHGWSFFLWFILVPLQPLLVRTGNLRWHRIFGTAATGLAVVMVTTGFVVATIKIHLANQPGGPEFWATRGLPILSLLLPFSIFFVTAIRRRKKLAQHKRLMLMASAVALPAATSRLVGFVTGIRPPPAGLGFTVAMMFIVAGMVYDQIKHRSVNGVYRWGLPLAVGVYIIAQILARTAAGEPVEAFFGWFGARFLSIY